jgi:hypothetical protein
MILQCDEDESELRAEEHGIEGFQMSEKMVRRQTLFASRIIIAEKGASPNP